MARAPLSVTVLSLMFNFFKFGFDSIHFASAVIPKLSVITENLSFTWI